MTNRFASFLLAGMLAATPVAAEEPAGTQIVFSKDTAVVTGEGATVEGRVVTISAGGTYALSGQAEDMCLRVNAGNGDTVELKLENLELFSAEGPVVYANVDELIIRVTEGSRNALGDAETRQEEEAFPTPAVYASDDLIFMGGGELELRSVVGHAAQCKDYLLVDGPVLTIDSANDGLHGNDGVSVLSGTVEINARGDGIQSTKTGDDKGNVVISGGTVSIRAEKDALQAADRVLITGGNVTLRSGEGVTEN